MRIFFVHKINQSIACLSHIFISYCYRDHSNLELLNSEYKTSCTWWISLNIHLQLRFCLWKTMIFQNTNWVVCVDVTDLLTVHTVSWGCREEKTCTRSPFWRTSLIELDISNSIPSFVWWRIKIGAPSLFHPWQESSHLAIATLPIHLMLWLPSPQGIMIFFPLIHAVIVQQSLLSLTLALDIIEKQMLDLELGDYRWG